MKRAIYDQGGERALKEGSGNQHHQDPMNLFDMFDFGGSKFAVYIGKN